MDKKSEFFDRVKNLPSGDRAALRRSCGIMLKDASGDSVLAFYRCLPYGVPEWMESRWFACACISCLFDADSSTSLEDSFSRMKDDSGSLEKRIATLLDMKWDEDGFFLSKLSRLIKMARQKGYSINFEKLLDNLIYWNNENEKVQRLWARALFLTKNEKNEIKGE